MRVLKATGLALTATIAVTLVPPARNPTTPLPTALLPTALNQTPQNHLTRFKTDVQTQQAAHAHQVEIVEDVGATLHIEPNDTPRAGEAVLAWFALTQKGGKTIPLADCNCQLTVYAQPKGTTAALTPPLSAIEAEGYQGIPGTTLTFPAVGAYTLVLSGQPKQAENFTPFEITFDVTVAANQSGDAKSSIPPETAADSIPETTPERPPNSDQTKTSAPANSRRTLTPLWVLSAGGIILLGLLFFFNKNK